MWIEELPKLVHQTFMQEAIREAQKAEAIDEVPIGAVVVFQEQVIGRGHNLDRKSVV